jgi:TusA-related sulfurtransferase
MNRGEVLEVLFDNPSSSESISAMCDASGNEIVDKVQEAGKFSWKIKKT